MEIITIEDMEKLFDVKINVRLGSKGRLPKKVDRSVLRDKNGQMLPSFERLDKKVLDIPGVESPFDAYDKHGLVNFGLLRVMAGDRLTMDFMRIRSASVFTNSSDSRRAPKVLNIRIPQNRTILYCRVEARTLMPEETPDQIKPTPTQVEGVGGLRVAYPEGIALDLRNPVRTYLPDGLSIRRPNYEKPGVVVAKVLPLEGYDLMRQCAEATFFWWKRNLDKGLGKTMADDVKAIAGVGRVVSRREDYSDYIETIMARATNPKADLRFVNIAS